MNSSRDAATNTGSLRVLRQATVVASSRAARKIMQTDRQRAVDQRLPLFGQHIQMERR
jgi:hypothetical protein